MKALKQRTQTNDKGVNPNHLSRVQSMSTSTPTYMDVIKRQLMEDKGLVPPRPAAATDGKRSPFLGPSIDTIMRVKERKKNP